MNVSKKLRSIGLTRGVGIVLLLTLCVEPAFAQRGKWWQDERMAKELHLTGEQAERLEAIFQKTQPTLRERMDALKQAEQELEKRIVTGDDAAIMRHLDVVEAARAELNKTRALMLLRMRRILTTDQWAKFTALADELKKDNRSDDRTSDRQSR